MRLEDFYTGKGTFRTSKTGKTELLIRFVDKNGEKKYKSFTANTEDECIDRALAFAKEYTEDLSRDDSTIPEILKVRFDKDLALNYIKIQSYYCNMNQIKKYTVLCLGNLYIKCN